MSNAAITNLKLDPKKKMGDFTDEELGALETALKNPEGAPRWMLNRRNDPFTGGDTHLISSDLKFQTKQDIDYMKKIKSYKGMRHAVGLKVRGQRTKSTGRKGATMGVQRKKLKMAAKKKKED